MAQRDLSKPWSMQSGATNFTRHEVQSWARKILSSQTHRDMIEKQVLAGTLPTPEKILLYHYAYGKPVEQINLTVAQGQEDLTQLSTEELAKRAKEVSDALEEARAVEDSIPADVVKGPW